MLDKQRVALDKRFPMTRGPFWVCSSSRAGMESQDFVVRIFRARVRGSHMTLAKLLVVYDPPSLRPPYPGSELSLRVSRRGPLETARIRRPAVRVRRRFRPRPIWATAKDSRSKKGDPTNNKSQFMFKSLTSDPFSGSVKSLSSHFCGRRATCK